jgi:hypothetical protein
MDALQHVGQWRENERGASSTAGVIMLSSSRIALSMHHVADTWHEEVFECSPRLNRKNPCVVSCRDVHVAMLAGVTVIIYFGGSHHHC